MSSFSESPQQSGGPLWSDEEFALQLRRVGEQSYHHRHPFHLTMNAGDLSRDQLQCWVANRFYYQRSIPVKDALLLSRCPEREVRRRWIQRVIDHDGTDSEPGGIEKWLRLGEGVGLSRNELEADCRLLPGVRYAVDAYVNFVAVRPWIEAIATSLTELFAPDLMTRRLEAFVRHYPWIDADALAYFQSRPPLASRDSEHALDVVCRYCLTREQQQRAVAALQFKCDVLWAQLDAIHRHCERDL